MAHKEEKIVEIKRYLLGEKLVEERVKVVRYIRVLDCKCRTDPYANGCSFCNEVIEPFLCKVCGNYYCKCDEIEDVVKEKKRHAF